MNFLKIEEGHSWGERPEKEGQLVELVGDQNPCPEAPPKSKRREQRSCPKTNYQRSNGEE